MNNKKIYDWEFGLFERAWGRRGVACPDCVNESNHKVWERFLDRAVRKLLRAETMETEEFRELVEEVCEEEAQRLAWEKRAAEMAEARRRRSCMARPKIDYVPKGLTVDLEEAYAEYFKLEVELRHGNSIATDKRYADSYKHLQHEIVCVGVSFSKEKRGINDYKYCKILSNRIL